MRLISMSLEYTSGRVTIHSIIFSDYKQHRSETDALEFVNYILYAWHAYALSFKSRVWSCWPAGFGCSWSGCNRSRTRNRQWIWWDWSFICHCWWKTLSVREQLKRSEDIAKCHTIWSHWHNPTTPLSCRYQSVAITLSLMSHCCIVKDKSQPTKLF